MKSTTNRIEDGWQEQVFELVSDWEQLIALLPTDLEASARETKAFVRPRELRSVVDLLRICLAYAVCDWSLRTLAAWCSIQGICHVSAVALLGRLRNSPEWLSRLIGGMIRQRIENLPRRDLRFRIRDATVISRPGSKGTDWRVHLSFDLGSGCLDSVELTDGRGGESLARVVGQRGDLFVGDRGHAFASGLGPVMAAGAWVAVRINWQNLPLFDGNGQRFSIPAWLQEVVTPAATAQEIRRQLPTPQGCFPVRLVAAPLPLEAANRARQRAREAAKKKGRTPDERTLQAAGFLLVLTTLPNASWSIAQLLDLYRIRWQVELTIKRLKSLLHLDELRAKDGQLAQTYLLAKLMAALVIEQMMQNVAQRLPFWFLSFVRPLSIWRLTDLLWHHLLSLIKGPLTLLNFVKALPRLHRYLRNAPRQRPQQDARIRSFLTAFSFT